MGGSHPLPVSLMLSPQPFGPFFIPISFVPLLYHTLRGLSRGFLHFFSWLIPVCVVVLRFLLTAKGTFPKLGTRSFLLTPLLYHNFGDLSRGFLHFFSSLRRWVSGSDRQIYQRSAGSDFGGTPCAPLPLTPIVYHRPHTKSTWQSAQLWDFPGRLFCSFCLLTNCWSCVIMEIPAPTTEGAAPKN